MKLVDCNSSSLSISAVVTTTEGSHPFENVTKLCTFFIWGVEGGSSPYNSMFGVFFAIVKVGRGWGVG